MLPVGQSGPGPVKHLWGLSLVALAFGLASEWRSWVYVLMFLTYQFDMSEPWPPRNLCNASSESGLSAKRRKR